jgi:hypothetical protein
MEVSGKLHTLVALFSLKETPVPIGQKAGWASRTSLDMMSRRKNSIIACARN